MIKTRVTYLSLLGPLLLALSLVLVLSGKVVVGGVVEEELTQALHGQHVQGPLAGLDQVG